MTSKPPLFHGEHPIRLDPHSRLAIPAAVRRQINLETEGPGFLLTLGMNRKVWIYPERHSAVLLAATAETRNPAETAGSPMDSPWSSGSRWTTGEDCGFRLP